jgi:multidrug efflux pump subunit AcrA (membrane-fusion protein)
MEQVGTIKTQNEAVISCRLMAQVEEVAVREGDPVTGPSPEGDQAAQPGRELAEPTLLVRLDDRDIQARLRQAVLRRTSVDKAVEAARAQVGAATAQCEAAEANRTQTEADHRRYQELYKNKAATGQQLEQVLARWKVAEAQVRAARQAESAAQADILRLEAQAQEVEAAVTEARVMLSYTQIRAPFSGRVARKFVEEGDMVAPGQRLFLIETPSLPELRSVVSESLLPHLHVGDAYDVVIDALQRTVRGTIREVVPRVDPATRTLTVKVALPPEPDLMGGLFGRLRIKTGEYEALVIPAEAARTVGQLRLVRVVEPDGVARRRFVTLGDRHGDVVEVLSGLEEGEAVVMP